MWQKGICIVLMLEIKVMPQSGRSTLMLDKAGILKCFIKAAPEKGKANEEVVEIIAKIADVSKGAVEIVSGWTSRKKLIRIQVAMTYEQFLTKIGSGVQKKIV